MPALRQPARPRRAPLPAQERQAPLSRARPVADDPLAVHVELLETARLSIEGRLVSASNATLYCRLGDDETDRTDTGRTDAERTDGPDDPEPDEADAPGDTRLACVYKPVSGERPLWDFPTGTLAAREVAAYEVSARTGWHLVPPTVLRDGPFGPGMCQLWVEHGPVDDLVDVVEQGRTPPGWFGVVDAQDGAGDPVTLVHADDRALRRTAVLDAVINNADRKAGHLLPAPDGLRVVDHGVTFNVDPKLRTVLWGWAGEPLAPDEVAVLRRLRTELEGALGDRLSELLDPDEVEETYARVDALVRVGTFPLPLDGWPSLPWPPF